MENEVEVLKRRVVDFESIYGPDWANKQRNLFKFFAKCFGCRIDEAGHDVPRDIIDLMRKDAFETALYITFQINEDVLILDPQNQPIGTEPLIAHKTRSTGEFVGYECGNYYRWFNCLYWYNHFPLEAVGASWIANSKFLYLGWDQPLTNEERNDLIAKVKESRESRPV